MTPFGVVVKGMNYVVAVLLLVMRDSQEVTNLDLGGFSAQEAAFWVTISMIRRNGMADLWKDKMPGFAIFTLEQEVVAKAVTLSLIYIVYSLSRCIYLFQQLLRLHFYDLSAHFRRIGMHSSILVTQVLLSLSIKYSTCKWC